MPRIVVTGRSEHHQPAERGTVHLGVDVADATAEEAVARAGRAHAAVVAEVRALATSGAVTWWSAENVVAAPFYEWHKPYPDRDGVRRLRHRAAATLQVKFRDAAALAAFSAHVATAPDVQVGHVEWALTEARRTELEAAARAGAVRDAVRRAQQYADALGLGPVRLVALYDEGLRPGVDGGGAGQMFVASMRSPGGGPGDGGELAVRPQDITVVVTVTADFDADPTGVAPASPGER